MRAMTVACGIAAIARGPCATTGLADELSSVGRVVRPIESEPADGASASPANISSREHQLADPGACHAAIGSLSSCQQCLYFDWCRAYFVKQRRPIRQKLPWRTNRGCTVLHPDQASTNHAPRLRPGHSRVVSDQLSRWMQARVRKGWRSPPHSPDRAQGAACRHRHAQPRHEAGSSQAHSRAAARIGWIAQKLPCVSLQALHKRVNSISISRTNRRRIAASMPRACSGTAGPSGQFSRIFARPAPDTTWTCDGR